MMDGAEHLRRIHWWVRLVGALWLTGAIAAIAFWGWAWYRVDVARHRDNGVVVPSGVPYTPTTESLYQRCLDAQRLWDGLSTHWGSRPVCTGVWGPTP